MSFPQDRTIDSWDPQLPDTLKTEVLGSVLKLTLSRAEKRNAINEELIGGIERVFTTLPAVIRAVVIDAEGDHFCAGLDLSEVLTMSADLNRDRIAHSRGWHRVFDQVQQGPVPVIAVLRGAVVGGGLELAATAHIRIAEPSTFYALPEGQHGIFVGGGASVRVPRLIGVSRMTEMMLTGRRYNAQEGQQIGLTHYLVDEGQGLALALDLANRAASNAKWSNYAVIQALPRIAQMNPHDGLFFESMTAAFVDMSAGESSERVGGFFDRGGRE